MPEKTQTHSDVGHARCSRAWGLIAQVIAYLGVLASIGIFGWYMHDHVALGVSVASFLALMILFRFEDLTRFKGLGVEIERAHKVTTEAAATIDQLRALASVVGKLGLDSLALRTRFGDIRPTSLLNVHDKMAQTLRNIGCSKEDITKATQLLEASIRFDLASHISQEASRELRERGVEKERLLLFGQQFRELAEKRGPLSPASASDFRKLLKAFGIDDVEALRDYEHYEKTGEPPSYDNDPSYFDLEMVPMNKLASRPSTDRSSMPPPSKP